MGFPFREIQFSPFHPAKEANGIYVAASYWFRDRQERSYIKNDEEQAKVIEKSGLILAVHRYTWSVPEIKYISHYQQALSVVKMSYQMLRQDLKPSMRFHINFKQVPLGPQKVFRYAGGGLDAVVVAVMVCAQGFILWL